MTLNTCIGAELPELLSAGKKDAPYDHDKAWRPVEEFMAQKPGGGLWTSPIVTTEDGGVSSHWIEVHKTMYSDPLTHAFQVEADPTASVVVIDSLKDLVALNQAFPLIVDRPAWKNAQDRYVDWFQVAEKFDAVYLTDAGHWRTRLSHPIDTYSWDCGTVWFCKPSFRLVKDTFAL